MKLALVDNSLVKITASSSLGIGAEEGLDIVLNSSIHNTYTSQGTFTIAVENKNTNEFMPKGSAIGLNITDKFLHYSSSDTYENEMIDENGFYRNFIAYNNESEQDKSGKDYEISNGDYLGKFVYVPNTSWTEFKIKDIAIAPTIKQNSDVMYTIGGAPIVENKILYREFNISINCNAKTEDNGLTFLKDYIKNQYTKPLIAYLNSEDDGINAVMYCVIDMKNLSLQGLGRLTTGDYITSVQFKIREIY